MVAVEVTIGPEQTISVLPPVDADHVQVRGIHTAVQIRVAHKCAEDLLD